MAKQVKKVAAPNGVEEEEASIWRFHAGKIIFPI